jgi:hypothetical protein
MTTQKNSYVETGDIKGRLTALVGWGFALLLVLMAGALLWIFDSSMKTWFESSGVYSIESFPLPRLLLEPKNALDQTRENENRELNSYAWIDANHKKARVPATRAMQIAAERGLIHIPAPAPVSGGSDAR